MNTQRSRYGQAPMLIYVRHGSCRNGRLGSLGVRSSPSVEVSMHDRCVCTAINFDLGDRGERVDEYLYSSIFANINNDPSFLHFATLD